MRIDKFKKVLERNGITYGQIMMARNGAGRTIIQKRCLTWNQVDSTTIIYLEHQSLPRTTGDGQTLIFQHETVIPYMTVINSDEDYIKEFLEKWFKRFDGTLIW